MKRCSWHCYCSACPLTLTRPVSTLLPWSRFYCRRGLCSHHQLPIYCYPDYWCSCNFCRRMRSRKSPSGLLCRMESIRRKYPNHTEIAYREAVAKLKYLLAESYATKMCYTKPLTLSSKRSYKENIIPVHRIQEDYADDTDAQSITSEASKLEVPTSSTRAKYYASKLMALPLQQLQVAASNQQIGTDGRAPVPSAEIASFIERQEDYIEQLERESHYCKEELRNLVEKVKEVIAENEALQEKNKTSFAIKSLAESYPLSCSDELTKREAYSPSPKPRGLEGPSIVFESRISELEAQLTQARLELRKARDENQENLTRLADRGDDAQVHFELDRALRERRDLEAKSDELQRELTKLKAHETELDSRSKRALELAQQAEFEKSQSEAEVKRLREELERRQEKLREALQETNRRAIEEKQQVEKTYSQQMEQLSADVATHWEAASKSQMESEKQKREIADLKRELAQKVAMIEDLKQEMQAQSSKVQEDVNQILAEKDAAVEELMSLKLTSERNERQAKQEQARMQGEINSYKMRLERADADLVHARRENIRLTEEIAALEKEINMNKIMGETRVGAQPSKTTDKVKEEKDKDKELASLILDLESKQAKTVSALEDSLNKQTSLVSRLTAECQSLTQRLEANDEKHKKEVADLQSQIEYLSNELRESSSFVEEPAEEEEEVPASFVDKDKTPSGLYSIEEDDGDEENDDIGNANYHALYNNSNSNNNNSNNFVGLDTRPKLKSFDDSNKSLVENGVNSVQSENYPIVDDKINDFDCNENENNNVKKTNGNEDDDEEEEELPLDYNPQEEAYGDEYANQQYTQQYDNQQYDAYPDYDPSQYDDYYTNQQYNNDQNQLLFEAEHQYNNPNADGLQYPMDTKQYLGLDGYAKDGYTEPNYYSNKIEEKVAP